MKKVRKITIAITSFLVLITSFFCLFGCVQKKSEDEIARDRIISLTEIEVPIESKIVYHSREATKFLTGRRAMYTVFEFESEPTDWLNKNSFNKEKNSEFERFFPSVFDFLPVKREEIPQEFLPNFEESYYYLRTTNRVYFVYIPKSFLLIVGIPGH